MTPYFLILIAALAAEPAAAPLSPGDPAKDLFEACLRAHRAMTAGAATIEVNQKTREGVLRTSYELAYVRPNQVMLRVREPEQAGRAATDRTFALVNGRMYAYDAKVHEQLTREAIPVGTLIQKLSTLVGQMDDSVAALIEPDRMIAFLRPFRTTSDWKLSKSGPETLLTRAAASPTRSTTVWKFDSATKRLAGLSIDVPNAHLDCRIKYRPSPKVVGWRPPKDAAKVSSFTLRPGSPNYADAATKAIAERSMLSYDRLRHVHYWTESTDGILKVWLSDGRLRQETRDLAFVVSGGQGMIRDDRNRRFYVGKAGVPTMVEALAKLRARIDPLVAQVLNRQNPVRMLLLPGIKVARIGNLAVGGVDGDLLEFKTATSTVTICIRRGDGLLSSLRSSIRDPEGNLIMENQRTLLYGPVGKTLDAALFKLTAPAGYSKLPLSSLLVKGKGS